jgi:ElaB/YqjD/DUF883 family membrane-anchored ribosome-binding protein
MDSDNGLRIVLNSLACMADYEHWNLEDLIHQMRAERSESVFLTRENYDSIMADLATVQNEREKLLRELADTQETYRKMRAEFDAAMSTAHEVQMSLMGVRQVAYEDQVRLADVLRLKQPAAFDTLFVRDQCLHAIEALAINQKVRK